MRLIAGIQPVREAIRARAPELTKVIVEAARPPSPELDALARFAEGRGAVVTRAPRAELDRLADGARHQGAIALAPDLRLTDLEELTALPETLLVVLDELQDPQNFGAIVRSAVALGATGLVWPEHRSAPLSPATFRASAGAIEHAVLCRVPALPSALHALRERGVQVLGLDMAGTAPLYGVDLRGPSALVVGSEGKGLRRTVKAACDALVRVPMPGPLASLNASVTAALALYEALRQRSAG